MTDQLPQNLDFLDMLQCPHSGEALRELSAFEISRYNQEIAEAKWSRWEGSQVEQPLERALINESEQFIYRIQGGIFVLLPNLALVPTRNLALSESVSGLMQDKKDVQDFYNQFGWNKTDDGHFHDADEFEDLRPVSRQYMYDCNLRIKRYIKPSGRFLLDAASGPIQYDEYLELSQDYDYRICVDLSVLALRQARQKLGNRGIYLVADITNLPVRSGSVDAVVSLNTIYHITKDEQVTAMQELYRVLQAGATGVNVYSWGRRSHLNNLLALPHKIVRKLKAMVRKSRPRKAGETPELYFHAWPLSYWTEERLGFPIQLSVWRLISVPVMKYYVHSWLGGKALLRSIYRLEDRRPEWCGKVGEYPMLVFEKEAGRAAQPLERNRKEDLQLLVKS